MFNDTPAQKTDRLLGVSLRAWIQCYYNRYQMKKKLVIFLLITQIRVKGGGVSFGGVVVFCEKMNKILETRYRTTAHAHGCCISCNDRQMDLVMV